MVWNKFQKKSYPNTFAMEPVSADVALDHEDAVLVDISTETHRLTESLLAFTALALHSRSAIVNSLKSQKINIPAPRQTLARVRLDFSLSFLSNNVNNLIVLC